MSLTTSIENQSLALRVKFNDRYYPIELYETAVDINCVIARFELGLIEIGYDYLSGAPKEMLSIHLASADMREECNKPASSCVCKNVTIGQDHSGNFVHSGYFVQVEERRRIEVVVSWNRSMITSGNTSLEIDGNTALLSGEIGTTTYSQIESLGRVYPKVSTLAFAAVSANTNDEIIRFTGRLIRRNGLNTILPANGDAQGGAVALFIAGTQRQVVDGGSFTVSNWYDDSERDKRALDLWGNLHQYRIAYFCDMLGADRGKECYFFIINLANYNPYRRLTRDEVQNYQIAAFVLESGV